MIHRSKSQHSTFTVPTMVAHPLNVLLVEDNAGDAEFVFEQLRHSDSEQIRATHVASLRDAVRQMLHRRFDAALLDLSLPDSQGLATLNEFLRHAPSTPTVVLTGYADENLCEQAIRNGAQDVLVKDRFFPSMLTRTVRHAVERHQANAENHRLLNELRVLSSQMPVIVWTTNLDLAITSGYGEPLKHLGLQPNQLIGVSLYDYLQTKSDNHIAIKAHRDALRGRKSSYEMEWQDRNYRTYVEPFRDQNGNIIGVVGAAVDVTESVVMRHDMNEARRIQQRLFPKAAPNIPGFDIAGGCRPAAMVGGDFFDYFRLGDGSQAVVVGDVTHHGFASGLLMTMTRRVIRTVAQYSCDPSEILTKTSRAIDADCDHFVELIMVQLDHVRGNVTYAAAGRNAFLLDADGTCRELPATGWFLGVDGEQPIEPGESFQMKSGDVLVLFTDGVNEALDKNGARLGYERLMRVVKTYRHEVSEQIVNHLFQAVTDHCLPNAPRDDHAVVIIKRISE